MKFLPLLLLLPLSACLTRQDDRPRPVINPLPEYTKNKPSIEHYGPWFVDKCTLVGGNEDFNISTEGRFEHNTLRLKLRSNTPLTRPPKLTLNVLNTPIIPEGKGRSFGFNLPFQAYEAAQYANESAYLFVHYQPLGSTTMREGFLALKPLLSGLGALSKRCP